MKSCRVCLRDPKPGRSELWGLPQDKQIRNSNPKDPIGYHNSPAPTLKWLQNYQLLAFMLPLGRYFHGRPVRQDLDSTWQVSGMPRKSRHVKSDSGRPQRQACGDGGTGHGNRNGG